MLGQCYGKVAISSSALSQSCCSGKAVRLIIVGVVIGVAIGITGSNIITIDNNPTTTEICETLWWDGREMVSASLTLHV